MLPDAVPADWPHRDHGRIVEAAGLRWHVQEFGAGPDALLLHGTGASGHSWAGIAPLLARHYRVLVPDLPGQGFTDLAAPERSSLAGVSRALAGLLAAVNCQPALIAGHSAGAAVAASLCLQGSCNPSDVISINGAMLPFGRSAAPVFSGAARLLASLPVLPQLVALHAVPRRPVLRMLQQTGSEPEEQMLRCYRRLVGSSRHVTGTLRMMANWDLPQLEKNLDRLQPALHLLICDNDQVVPPAQGAELAARLPSAEVQHFPGLGHLGHEEAPARFADYLIDCAGR